MNTRAAPLMLSALLLGLPSVAGATAQVPDRLTYKGKQHPLFSTPLEAYLRQRGKRFKSDVGSTACWRGYVASWIVKKGRLYLQGVRQCHGDPPKPLATDEVLGKPLPLRASWFSGVLRVPLGKRLRYVHMGFHSVYERELLLWFRAGKLTGKRVIDNRPGKRKPATRPLTAKQVARAMAPVRRSIIAHCLRGVPRAERPEAVLINLEVAASGIPRTITIIDRLDRALKVCVHASVFVEATFPVTDGISRVQHWMKLR